MKRYRQDSESQEHAPYQQQQQQTTVEKQERPFFPPTTPAWGDRNVDEQLAEENSGDFDLSLPSTSKGVVSYQSSTSSSSLCDSTDSTTNNQSTNQPLPRKCKLCSYVLMESEEYLDHMITHCIFRKEAYDEDTYFNGYVDDEELDNPDNSESQNHGRKKNKTPKSKDCQKCSFIAETKLEFWVHLRQHFVQGDCSGYVCPKCPFASMLKHHMNFHWCSAHDDFKPYSCKHCDYTCVSKSMLTSHLKTHSNVYQFNCATCPYRTKFCNAMKKHLKDTLHQPSMVLRPDGTPNPDITIDVYGTKRGPRQKSLVEQKNESKESIENGPSSSTLISPVSLIPVSSAPISPILSAAIPSTSNALDFNAASMSPARESPVQISSTPMSPSQSNALATIAHYQTVFSRMSIENGVNPNINPNFDQTLPLYENVFLLYRTLLDEATIYQDIDDEQREQILRLLQNIHKNLTSDQEHIEQAATSNTSRHLSDNAWAINEPSTSTTLVSELEPAAQENTSPDQPLDLSMSTMSRQGHQLHPQESVASCSSRRKRKRKATRLEHLLTNENTNEQNTNRAKKNPIAELTTASQSNFQGENQTFNMTISTINNKRYACYTCQIIFVNKIMYAVHMSFHKSENPLECAICYKRCTDVIDFSLHIVRARH